MTSPIAKHVLRPLAFILALTVLTVGLPMNRQPLFSAQAESSIDELSSQKDELAAKQEELAEKRDEAAATLEEQQEQSEIIQEQIDAKSEEIALNQQILAALDVQIADTQAQIAAKEAEIAGLEVQIAERQELLNERLRAISKKSTFSTFLQCILGGGTFADYLIGMKMTQRISAYDQAIMDALESDILALEDTKNKLKTDIAALEIEKTQAEAIKSDMEADKDSLQLLYDESDAMAAEMAQNVEYFQQQLEETLAKQQNLQNEIDAILESIRAEEEAARKEAEENGEEYDPYKDGLVFTGNGDGTMLWPTPTCPVITSSFGWREWSESWHKGIDIACYGDAEGEPIVAAADGTVRVFYDEYGYGNYITIDHGYDSEGRRILTVYAHCSRVDVSFGDSVTAGQQIGLVGDTGRSDGAHLHFEVNIDGIAVDPIAYGYLSTDGIDVLG